MGSPVPFVQGTRAVFARKKCTGEVELPVRSHQQDGLSALHEERPVAEA